MTTTPAHTTIGIVNIPGIDDAAVDLLRHHGLSIVTDDDFHAAASRVKEAVGDGALAAVIVGDRKVVGVRAWAESLSRRVNLAAIACGGGAFDSSSTLSTIAAPVELFSLLRGFGIAPPDSLPSPSIGADGDFHVVGELTDITIPDAPPASAAGQEPPAEAPQAGSGQPPAHSATDPHPSEAAMTEAQPHRSAQSPPGEHQWPTSHPPSGPPAGPPGVQPTAAQWPTTPPAHSYPAPHPPAGSQPTGGWPAPNYPPPDSHGPGWQVQPGQGPPSQWPAQWPQPAMPAGWPAPARRPDPASWPSTQPMDQVSAGPPVQHTSPASTDPWASHRPDMSQMANPATQEADAADLFDDIRLGADTQLGKNQGLAPAVVDWAGKGGVGKTSVSICLAQTASAAGLRVVLIDGSRGQTGVGVVLRIAKPNVPTIYDAAATGDIRRCFISPDRLNGFRRSSSLEEMHFSVVQAPPDAVADPTVVTSQLYSEVIELARRTSDLVIIDTQILEASAHSRHTVFQEAFLPLLRGSAWGVGITDTSREGFEKLQARLKELSAAGVPRDRMLTVINRFDPFQVNPRSAGRAYQPYAEHLGVIEEDPQIMQALNAGRSAADLPGFGKMMSAILARVTGDTELFSLDGNITPASDEAPAAGRESRKPAKRKWWNPLSLLRRT